MDKQQDTCFEEISVISREHLTLSHNWVISMFGYTIENKSVSIEVRVYIKSNIVIEVNSSNGLTMVS